MLSFKTPNFEFTIKLGSGTAKTEIIDSNNSILKNEFWRPYPIWVMNIAPSKMRNLVGQSRCHFFFGLQRANFSEFLRFGQIACGIGLLLRSRT